MKGFVRILPQLLAAMLLLLVFSGCSTYYARFSPPVLQESSVILKENDFQYVERNREGSYSYWSLWFGAPVEGWYLEIPLGDPRLFSNSLADMYAKCQEQTEGRAGQMVNWTLDYRMLMFPFLAEKSAIFRADLIEYTKK
jgi:hypothetical protein